ncbi:MAG: bifunctional (p)ppGpp synthetase/guanosine-3',5'-bis(diphosphate) 3'-pyrophosphohydrolase [Clostridia bacterium]
MDRPFELLVADIRKYNPNSNFSLIEKAYEFAKNFHTGQMRDSGEPFVNHPVEVARILATLELNSKTIAAGILHDVIEDTNATFEQVAKEFGLEIAQMVDGVSTLSTLHFATKKEHHIENIRKMFLAMSKDIRVIIIKLSDRLHNMRTLQHVSVEKQLEKSKETLEIYAPIAHRLGMSAFKWELEDLSFRYLHKQEYYQLVNGIAAKRKEREEYIDDIILEIKQNLKEKDISANVDGRVKHLYSIYKKMQEQGKELENIFDLFALRIIVDSISDCYSALGLVHELYRPVPGRFKDYIAMPKNNMYQSLHTTLIGSKGITFEVQIRTWQMHSVAEFGIAAHWKYKQGLKETTDADNKLAWLRQLVEWQKDTNDSDEFYDTLRIDLFDDEVFVFTPKGDVINLPAKSTSIDFAYAIHSAVGNKMIGAKVNGKIEPLTYRLQNGDIIEILTSASSRGPSMDWLKMVKSSQAKNKIKQFFKKERREENIEKGKDMVERELKRQGISFQELFKPQYYEEMLKRYNFINLEDAFCAIGYSGISSNKVITKVREEYKKQNKEEQEPLQQGKLEHEHQARKRSEQGIVVRDIDNCLVKISRCCNPLPGDDITGYITRGKGVTVHRKDCINVLNNPQYEARLIEVAWSDEIKETYQSEISIKCYDRNNILAEITKTINDSKVPINAIEAKTSKDGTAMIRMRLQINDKDELANIIKKIKRISGIIEISRTNRRVKSK